MNKRLLVFILITGFVSFFTKLSAFNTDTTVTAAAPPKTVKLPKHYFNKTIYTDLYSFGKRNLDTINNPISKQLKSYHLSQFSLGFNLPVITKTYYNKDSTRTSSINFLLTASTTSINVNFGGIRDHRLSKSSLGFRGIYNNGKRSIFFVEFSPFTTVERGYSYTRTFRSASTFLYDFAVSPAFSVRLGYTRSFLLGTRLNLPYIGMRVGKINKINFSLQFPRSVTFNVPIGRYVRTSLFTKPQGGVYTFANTDSIHVGNANDNKKLYFGRYEFLSGLRIDALPSKYFNFYASGGILSDDRIFFFPSEKSKNLSPNEVSYKGKIKGTIFLNFGFVIRFGKTRSIYNNSQMYEAIDLNNSIDPGDNGINPGNGNILRPGKAVPKVTPDEVIDLIEAQDIY